MYRSMGFLFERMLELAFTASLTHGRFERPGEFSMDGIAGSPDLIDKSLWRLLETKATWRSSAKLERIEKYFWKWLVQVKSYCNMIGTDEAQILAFFINGNYRGSGPEIKVVDLGFTQRELDDNWRMLKQHAKRRGWL